MGNFDCILDIHRHLPSFADSISAFSFRARVICAFPRLNSAGNVLGVIRLRVQGRESCTQPADCLCFSERPRVVSAPARSADSGGLRTSLSMLNYPPSPPSSFQIHHGHLIDSKLFRTAWASRPDDSDVTIRFLRISTIHQISPR